MFSSRTLDNLNFVSRQVAASAGDGSLESAIDKVSTELPDEYQGDLQTLRGVIDQNSDGAATSFGVNPLGKLSKLFSHAGSSRTRLFVDFVSYIRENNALLSTYWAGIVGLGWYLAGVSLTALTVTLLFSTTVLPAFSELFDGFGAPLPEYTRVVFDSASTSLPVLAVLLALVLVVVFTSAGLFHRRVQQLEPLPRWPAWAPLVGRLAEAHNLGLFLNFLRMLRASGVEESAAVGAAAKEANLPDGFDYQALLARQPAFSQSNTLTELGVAARLGQLDNELDYQCEQHAGEWAMVLLEVRDRFSLILKLFLFALVAALVIAMYLPIFSMGAVI